MCEAWCAAVLKRLLTRDLEATDWVFGSHNGRHCTRLEILFGVIIGEQ